MCIRSNSYILYNGHDDDDDAAEDDSSSYGDREMLRVKYEQFEDEPIMAEIRGYCGAFALIFYMRFCDL